MGGCRCTYKNCTVRSDGKTHLFHFPVFDKVRCHQWLTNASRFDFLHLRVSQLKNRCICQHHFTDNNFMNDFKEKLKLEAVPTLDGPYCDTSKYHNNEMPQNHGLCPIAHEDIENDEYMPDRKANYNLRYSEFLTNCETDPMQFLHKNEWDSEGNVMQKSMDQHAAPVNVFYNNNIKINEPVNDSFIDIKPSWDTFTHEKQTPLQIVPNPCMNAPKLVNVTVPSKQLPKKRTNKIRIISEKKITEPEKKIPLPVKSKSLRVVSPSMVLRVKNKNKNVHLTDITSQESPSIIMNSNNAENAKVNYMIPDVSSGPVVLDSSNDNQKRNVTIAEPQVISSGTRNLNNKETNKNVSPPKPQTNHKNEQSVEQTISYDPSQFEVKINVEEFVPSTPVNRTMSLPNTKKKLSPERVAAINQKRKFNMKLRDIIEEGLNRLDENEEAKRKEQNKIDIAETVASSLSKETSLPNKNYYIVSYLESRMKKMENLLLNKIDQNTLKITELKNTLKPEKKDPEVSLVSRSKNKLSKSAIEAHKKNIFNEISKFLSPGTSSLVYEELFISKFKPKELNADTQTPAKKRRHR